MNTEHDQEQADKGALQRWGDTQQYDAAPMQANGDENTGALPRVSLLWMTPDPLGAVAAACRMYEGKPTMAMTDMTQEERVHYWRQAQATHLKAPLEFVKFHFFIEGVDRSFTHQMVRQRTAVYAQESQRFAVLGDLMDATTVPPSLHGTKRSEEGYHPANEKGRQRAIWDDTIRTIDRAYRTLVENGMPSEEARGLLPNATATRLNYSTDLRALLDHAGNRLCTQAQFHWRLVFAQIMRAIRQYPFTHAVSAMTEDFEMLTEPFKPVCYEQGRCPFKASFDRDCSIRDRVDAFAEHGVPSSEWDQPHKVQEPDAPPFTIQPISDSEWAMDPAAARRNS